MPPSKSLEFKRKVYLSGFCLLIFLITCLGFSPALDNGFVNWDDHIYVYDNPIIQTINADHLKQMFMGFRDGNWFPVTWLTHAMDFRLHGLDPRGHHLTSILLHSANAVLVFHLFLMLGRRVVTDGEPVPGLMVSGMVAALVFALHPLRVESVAWVSERKDLLCGFFVLATLITYVRYSELDTSTSRAAGYGLALVFFILALASKPMAVTVPVVLLILDWYPLDRLSRSTARRVLVEKIPFFLLSLGAGLVTLMAQKKFAAVRTFEEIGIQDRFLNALHSLSFYLEQTLWPSSLVPFRPFDLEMRWWSGKTLAAVLVLAGITFICVRLWRRGIKLGMAAWVYYLVTVSPVIGILQVGEQAAADRYTYLPALGLAFVIGAAVFQMWQRNPRRFWYNSSKAAVVAGFTAVFAAWLVLASRQIGVWKNGETLWTTVQQASPENAVRATMNLGLYYYDLGRWDEAENTFLDVLKSRPRLQGANHNLGLVYFKKKDFNRAEKYLKTELALDPQNIEIHSALGLVYMQTGRLSKAEDRFRRVIQIQPGKVQAHNNLGLVLFRQGRYERAEEEFLNALRENPDHVETRINLGTLYYDTGRLSEAEREYATAAKLDPANPDAMINLGAVYFEMGRLQDAMESFQKVLAIDPDHARARAHLGMVYYQMNRVEDAVRELQNSIRLASTEAQYYLYLGMVQVKAGNFPEAEAALKTSLTLRPGMVEAQNQLGIVYGLQGDIDASRKAFEAALAADPDHAAARSNLDRLLDRR